MPDLAGYGTLYEPNDLPERFSRVPGVDRIAEQFATDQPTGGLVLLGPPGCGKTSLLYEAARRSKKAVLETNCTILQRDTEYVGRLQDQMLGLFEGLRSRGDVILYLTDLAAVAEAGTYSGAPNMSIAATLMDPIRRQELKVVGDLNEQQLSHLRARNPGFEALLHCEKVASPSRVCVHEILNWCAWSQSAALTPGAADLVLTLSSQFFVGLSEPGRSVRILTVCLRSLATNCTRRLIDERVVLQAFQEWSGMPMGLIDDSMALEGSSIEALLGSSVKGQSHAVAAVVDRLCLRKSGLSDERRPIGAFMFVGPSGVGKTLLAQSLAEYLFGSRDRLLRYDMTEYSSNLAYTKLIGDHSASDRSERVGTLTSRVQEWPFSVVLLDEIEKAHESVHDLLLQVLDEARLTDATGKTVSFAQCMLIMTSNTGFTEEDNRSRDWAWLADGEGRDELEHHIDSMLRRKFRPEFMNRIDSVVMFDPLRADELQDIARIELERALSRPSFTRRDIEVTLCESIYVDLAEKNHDVLMGARPVKRAVEREVLIPLAKELAGAGASGAYEISLRDGKIRIEKKTL